MSRITVVSRRDSKTVMRRKFAVPYTHWDSICLSLSGVPARGSAARITPAGVEEARMDEGYAFILFVCVRAIKTVSDLAVSAVPCPVRSQQGCVIRIDKPLAGGFDIARGSPTRISPYLADRADRLADEIRLPGGKDLFPR